MMAALPLRFAMPVPRWRPELQEAVRFMGEGLQSQAGSIHDSLTERKFYLEQDVIRAWNDSEYRLTQTRFPCFQSAR
jgi:hypothetical protein